APTGGGPPGAPHLAGSAPGAAAVATPIGRLTIVTIERAVVATLFDDQDAAAELERLERRLGAGIRSAPRELGLVRREVDAYFAGNRRPFEIPVDLRLAGEGF